MAPLCRTPIRELRRRISAGELSAEALARDAITCRQQLEPVLGAYHQCQDEALLDAAAALDAQPAKSGGTLAGIPMSLKSVFGLQGYQCFAGAARPLPDSWSAEGPVASHLKRSGALVTGTTHAGELSVGGLGVNPHWGTPRNPWDAAQHRVPGGSSAGAAISVWEGACAFALGTDTGGSVRVPASLAGLVGFKPSEVRWPMGGIMPLASRFDTIGIMALCVEDVLQVVRCIDELASASIPRELSTDLRLANFHFRRASPNCWSDLDDGIIDAIENALDSLCLRGMRLTDNDDNLYADAALKRDEGPNTAAVELLALLEKDAPELLPHLSAHVAQFLESARAISEQAYRTRVNSFSTWRRAVHKRMAAEDIVVLPTVRATPPTLQRIENRDEYVHYSDFLLHNTVLPSFNGSCAITLPVGLDAAGMPVGLQLVARAGAEYTLLQAALLVEQQLGTAQERIGLPPLCRDASGSDLSATPD